MTESTEAVRTRRPASDAVVTLSSSRLSDAELLAGVVSRDARALAELFDRYLSLLERLLFRMLGSNTDVDDVVQEVFLVVVRRARDVENPSALRSFIVGTAIRTAKYELRKRAARRWIGLDDASPPSVASHDPIVTQRVHRAYAALDRMDTGSRALFVLRFIEGLELTEIAEATGCSLATVKRKLGRATKRFRAIAAADAVLRECLEEGER